MCPLERFGSSWETAITTSLLHLPLTTSGATTMRPCGSSLAAPSDHEIEYYSRDSAPPELAPLESKRDTVDDLHVPATDHPTVHTEETDSLVPPCSGRCIITGQLTSNRWFPKRPRRDDDVCFPHSIVSLGLLSPDAGFSH